MRLATDLVLALCGYCLTWSTTSTGVLASKQDIEADVCVIGGGSSTSRPAGFTTPLLFTDMIGT